MVLNGIENLKSIKEYTTGKTVGLITNPTGLDKDFVSTVDIINANTKLVKLYAPEHGIRGNLQAGKGVENEIDEKTKLPVLSAFQKDFDLDGVQVLIYDIQDVGLRFYTYPYVLANAMKAAAKANIPVIVLDRINPLGLTKTEGPVIEKEFYSGVGGYALPVRYGLTIGELARYINGEFRIGCSLYVVPCQNLTRETAFEQSGQYFIMPSPNCPALQTVKCYVGNCLFEGTNVSEGRGTTKPMEFIGAPWMDGGFVSNGMNKQGIKGVKFRPVYFTPTFSKYKGEQCSGVQTIITDDKEFNSFDTAIKLMYFIRDNYKEFKFNGATDFSNDTFYIDKLAGTDAVRKNGYNESFIKKQEQQRRQFTATAQKYWLY